MFLGGGQRSGGTRRRGGGAAAKGHWRGVGARLPRLPASRGRHSQQGGVGGAAAADACDAPSWHSRGRAAIPATPLFASFCIPSTPGPICCSFDPDSFSVATHPRAGLRACPPPPPALPSGSGTHTRTGWPHAPCGAAETPHILPRCGAAEEGRRGGNAAQSVLSGGRGAGGDTGGSALCGVRELRRWPKHGEVGGRAGEAVKEQTEEKKSRSMEDMHRCEAGTERGTTTAAAARPRPPSPNQPHSLPPPQSPSPPARNRWGRDAAPAPSVS